MDITITAKEKHNYLLIESKGLAQTKEDLLLHCQLIKEEILKHTCGRILINEPETHFSNDITDYFDLVKNYVETWPPEIGKLKIAAVVAPAYKEFADTWETLCVSKGFMYFAFTSFDKAKTWLLEELD